MIPRASLLTRAERDFLIKVITDVIGIDADLEGFVTTAKHLLRAVPGLEKTAETHVYRLSLELWSRYRGVSVTKH